MSTHTALVTASAVLLTSILAFPSATAQVADPTANVYLEMASGPETVAVGQAKAVPATVTWTASNFTCSEEATFVVTVSFTEPSGAVDGINVSVEPTDLNFTVASGVHASAEGEAVNESAGATLNVEVGPTAPSMTNHTVGVTADFPAQLPDSCNALGDLPAASATATYTLTTPEIEEDEPTETTTPPPADGNETAEGDSPSLGVPSLLATALVVGILARRGGRDDAP